MMLALAVFAGAVVLVLVVQKRRLFSREEERAGIRVLSASEMAKRLAEGWRPLVLDVRTVREYRGPLGHMAGSLLVVPLPNLPAGSRNSKSIETIP
jgi:hypothetical protein